MTLRGWALFATVSVLWGIPYLFIKVSVEELAPGFVAWSRVAMAAAILLPIAWKKGALKGLPVKWLALFAAAEVVIPFPLIAWGETRISSSLAAILVAALPLIIAAIAVGFDASERPTRNRLVGMLVGLSGVVALVGIDIGGRSAELLGAGAVLLATVGYAVGPMVIKHRLSQASPLGPIAGGLGLATIMLAPFGIGGIPSEVPSGDVLASMITLGLVCTALAFLFFFRLIVEVGPGRASVITYVNPVVALALGVAILGESVTAGAVVGLFLILAGSWLATDGRLPPGLAAVGTLRSKYRGARGKRAEIAPLVPITRR